MSYLTKSNIGLLRKETKSCSPPPVGGGMESFTPSSRSENRLLQWRIQDFPGGGAKLQSGCANLLFFLKTAWKW